MNDVTAWTVIIAIGVMTGYLVWLGVNDLRK